MANSHGFGDKSVSRRQVLQVLGLAAAGVSGVTGLAGCGGGSDDGGSTDGGSSTGGGGQQSGGILTHGATGGSSKDTIDPHVPVTNPDIARVSNLYEPLLFWDADYKLAPALATSVEPSSDAKTWTITLRDGVTFHNGKTVTGEDVLFSIQRVADPKAPKPAGGQLSKIVDFTRSKSQGNQVTLALKQPYAILDFLLAEYTLGIIPTDFDVTKPVGTGAFAYESFTPGQSSTFTKFANYWGDKAFVDQLVIQDFPDDSAKVNALLANQIQTIDNLPTNLIDSVKSQGGSALESNTGAWVPFTMRVDSAPFSDKRVRQAMRLIVDRQQMIDQALSGYGELGNDLYAPFDPSYAGKVFPQRQQDIEQAKSLLKSAGQSDLQVELFTGDDIGSVAPAAASLFVQQAKLAGVEVKVTKKNPFYGDDYLSYPFAQDFWNTRQYIPQAAVGSQPGGAYNETHFDNADFNKLINDASRELDETKRNTLLQDAQKIEYDEGGYIIWGFRRQVDGYSSDVQGLTPSRYLPLGSYKFNKVSV